MLLRWIKRIAGLALFVGAVYVSLQFRDQNAEIVAIDYVAGRVEAVPLYLALLGAFGLGAGLTGLLASWRLLRLQLVTWRYRRTARGLEAEIHQLRSLPLADSEGPGTAGALAASGSEPLERGA